LALDRFELLELRRDGGIQTYHAREITTARPVQVHLFAQGLTAENVVLLKRVDRLSDSERRRVLERGNSRGLPYVVTDRLAGYADFREWLTANASSAANPSLDEQFLQLFESATPIVAPILRKPSQEQVDNPKRILPIAAKSLAGLVLGILTALVFLAVAVAFFFLKPR
jgi:hypothetical protein